jgi:hypothetical protein
MTATEPAPLLRVRCGAQCGAWGSGGHLVIEPGAARFEIRRLNRLLDMPPVIRAQPPLVWKRARLLPPGLDSGLIMRGEEGTVTVFTWWGKRGRIGRALHAAGVEVIEQATWVSIGWSDATGRRPPGPGAS